MTNGLALLLLITGFASVLAAIPQLIKLVRLKHSDEFSLFSWIIWLLYQIISVIYSLHIRAVAYAIINTLWVGFYSCMIFLIIRYRR